METHTELAVIGGGPGGYAAAFYAADLGMQVTIIDAAPKLGGVCLWSGCIPSKTYLHVARIMREAGDAAEFGLRYQPPAIDLAALRNWKDRVLNREGDGLALLAKYRKVRVISGQARFIDATTLGFQTASGAEERLTFDYAILATGSRPVRPRTLAIESSRVWDSTAGLMLPEVPRRLLIVGGGYIGLELGTVYAALGSQITIVEMSGTVLPIADADLVKILVKRLGSIFHEVRLNTTVTALEEAPSGIIAKLQTGDRSEAVEFDQVLIAVGRAPNSEVAGLSDIGVAVDAKGFVVVNGARRTSCPNVFAIGDVTGEPMLAHKASHEARTAVDAIRGGSAVFEPKAIPAVVFTDPEIAWCGLTEASADRDGRQVKVARFPWAALGRASLMNRMDGMTKLVVDPSSESIVGVGIVGVNAGDLISEGALAIESGRRASDLGMTIHPHPTLSEATMEAADSYFGYSTSIFKPIRRD